MTTGVFERINNAVLDLQSSQLQTYERPLKQLGRLLASPELEAANRQLTQDVDLEAFLEASEHTGGSFVGSQTLAWPDNPEECLGLSWLLIQKLARDPDEVPNFCLTFFHTGNQLMGSIHNMVRSLVIPFVRDYKAHMVRAGGEAPTRTLISPSERIFVVHGHDEGARESVARFIEQMGFVPIILHEQANRGRTIIEKVEAYADVGFAVVLLTPDDEGRSRGMSTWEARARQNVLLELGYFIGRLSRERVFALKRGDVAIPSDFAGVVWQTMDADGGWKHALAREWKDAGYAVDMNRLLR